MSRTVYRLVVLLLGVAAGPVLAQQEPQLSMYMYNPLYYNPAAAGSEGVSRIQLTQRTQYLGYQAIGSNDEAVQNSQVLSFNMPLAGIKSGIGIYVLNDKAGPNINQSVQASYAYRLPLKSGTLALGVQAGLYNIGFDYGLFRPEVPDPLIPSGRITQAKPDIGAGVYYNTVDYWVGLSLTHINRAQYVIGTDRSALPLNPNAYLTAGYRLGVGYDIDIQPSILVRYNTLSSARYLQATLNVVGTYANRFWAGVGYRLQESAIFTGGINFGRANALRVGYSLDLVLVSTQARSLTSHEIILGYALPAPDARKKPIVRTPRFRY
ncbi:PorP/SprF family type IX secretion system membrane protein [Spirosoma rhododendri]|uniref:Type IX secretion system membrane protein PorP/SprF n=1 Tax=Spirosoma rhododendri TaxID=2728024 RepID=A0A7L5DU91_9BACT|nr:type IX secretion system membrane protein PorP/SprF [Spirosoma rhododendri]QJD81182.1 type IX secretion system membrane protein PorP/SprF [Spirosoma rhododendri]